MAIIERHLGCANLPNQPHCWGPSGPYYTLFGSEFGSLTIHAFVAVILGLIIYGLLTLYRVKGKIRIHALWILLISVVSTIALFFLFALLLPVRVIY
jgi:hypothetical protein